MLLIIDIGHFSFDIGVSRETIGSVTTLRMTFGVHRYGLRRPLHIRSLRGAKIDVYVLPEPEPMPHPDIAVD